MLLSTSVLPIYLGIFFVYGFGGKFISFWPLLTSFFTLSLSVCLFLLVSCSQLVVQFEDDADQDTGKTPHRRINSKLVLPQPDGP